MFPWQTISLPNGMITWNINLQWNNMLLQHIIRLPNIMLL